MQHVNLIVLFGVTYSAVDAVNTTIPFTTVFSCLSLPTVTHCAGGRHKMPPSLHVDLLTLKVVSESRVTWATSVPILVFLGLSVLGPMYATDRHQIDRFRRASLLNALP